MSDFVFHDEDVMVLVTRDGDNVRIMLRGSHDAKGVVLTARDGAEIGDALAQMSRAMLDAGSRDGIIGIGRFGVSAAHGVPGESMLTQSLTAADDDEASDPGADDDDGIGSIIDMDMGDADPGRPITTGDEPDPLIGMLDVDSEGPVDVHDSRVSLPDVADDVLAGPVAPGDHGLRIITATVIGAVGALAATAIALAVRRA